MIRGLFKRLRKPDAKKSIAIVIVLLVFVLLGLGFASRDSNESIDLSSEDYSIAELRSLNMNHVVKKVREAPDYDYELIYDNLRYSEKGLSTTELIERSPFPIEAPIDWDWSYEENRSKNFNIHAWDMLNPFLSEHSNSQNTEYLEHVLGVVLDWIAQNEFEAINNEEGNFAWYDMTVGVRTYRLSYLLDQVIKQGIADTETYQTLWDSLLEHLEFLAVEDNIIYKNNHGIYQSAGQMAMARRLNEVSSQFIAVRNQADRRFEEILARQFTEEGIHKEHSPGYHKAMYLLLLSMKDEALLTDSNSAAFIQEAGDALYWMIKPDGHLAQVGDTNKVYIEKDKETYSDVEATDLRYYVSDGDEQYAPGINYAVYPESGIVSVKEDQSFLFAQTAFHTTAHKHADDSSFVWYEEEEILIDPGLYGYLGRTSPGDELHNNAFWYSDPNRVYVEKTSSHNTVEIDERDYIRKRKPYGSAIKQHAVSGTGVHYIESRVVHFGSIAHERHLLYKPAEWLLVIDHMDDEETHDYRQWFHLSENFDVETIANGYKAVSDSTSNVLFVTDATRQATLGGPFEGVMEPQMRGWRSPAAFEIIPSPSLNFTASNTESNTFVTLFTLGENRPTITENTIDGAEQTGTLSWTSDMNHSLQLDLDEEKPQILYKTSN